VDGRSANVALDRVEKIAREVIQFVHLHLQGANLLAQLALLAIVSLDKRGDVVIELRGERVMFLQALGALGREVRDLLLEILGALAQVVGTLEHEKETALEGDVLRGVGEVDESSDRVAELTEGAMG
jgi:hypothetical protein